MFASAAAFRPHGSSSWLPVSLTRLYYLCQALHGLGEFSSPGQLASQKSQVFDQEGGLEIVLTPYCTDMENDTPCRRVTCRIPHNGATMGFKPSPTPVSCVQFSYSLLMLPPVT